MGRKTGMRPRAIQPRLFVTDIDNTLFDWVAYYVAAFQALLAAVADQLQMPRDTLAAEARAVFSRHASIEYPFVVQELPSVIARFGDDIDGMLTHLVEPARAAFLTAAEPHLRPFPTVLSTLQELRRRFPGLPCVALTDAPRYVAMWKLNKLGLLSSFDAVYGLPDPRLPTHDKLGKVKVGSEILLKHLSQHNFAFAGKIRVLPDDYEKPGRRGLKTVLMDFDLDEAGAADRRQVVWVGDNRRKDVALGKSLGVFTVWAAYGTANPADLKALADFSPAVNIEKNAAIMAGDPDAPEPDAAIREFADLLAHLTQR